MSNACCVKSCVISWWMTQSTHNSAGVLWSASTTQCCQLQLFWGHEYLSNMVSVYATGSRISTLSIGRVGTTEVMYAFWWDPMSDGWNAISYIFPQLGSNVVSKGEAVHCYVPNGSEKIFDHLLKRAHQVKMDLWVRAPQFGHFSWIQKYSWIGQESIFYFDTFQTERPI